MLTVSFTQEEALQFGGEANAPYDANYHQAGDTVDNLDLDAFLLNTRSIANSIALYATDLSSIPPRAAGVPIKRSLDGNWPHGPRAQDG